MANKKRGYISVKLGGKQRTLHFSMNFWAALTDDLNIRLDELGSIFENGVSLNAVRSIVYCGLLAYDQEEGNEIEYNKFKVGSWLEDLDADGLNKIILAMGESRILGNDLNMGIERNPDSEGK